MEWWRCSYCHYIHAGALPEGLVCPRCRQLTAVFEQVELENEVDDEEYRYRLYKAKLDGV